MLRPEPAGKCKPDKEDVTNIARLASAGSRHHALRSDEKQW